MKEIRKLVDKLLIPFGGVSENLLDDFYSDALYELYKCIKRYSPEKCDNFDNWYKFCLVGKIKQRLTYMHRDKRCNIYQIDHGNDYVEIVYEGNMSLDMHIDAEDPDSESLVDFISYSKGTVEDMVFNEDETSKKLDNYLSRLTDLQKQIAALIGEGYKKDEIINILNISKEKYTENLNDMKNYRVAKYLL